MPAQENETVVRRYLEEAWGEGRVNILDDLATQGAIDHNTPPTIVKDISGWKETIGMIRTAFPDFKVKVEEIVVQGDTVTARWVGHGTHKHQLLGWPATGKPVTILFHDTYRLADGKMVERWSEVPLVQQLAELGVAPQLG